MMLHACFVFGLFIYLPFVVEILEYAAQSSSYAAGGSVKVKIINSARDEK